MATTIQVDIVSAEQAIYSGPATAVFAPAIMGEVGILPQHAPFLTKIKAGEVRVKTPDGSEESIYVSGGILEVQPYLVTVLADHAVRAKDLDEAAALEAKQRAEQTLADRQSGSNLGDAEAKLTQALAQLKMIEIMRNKPGRY